ncbi:MAG: (d)CMP kinase [Oscillospiraceae bacterium]|jgi:cytidylate kinase|nr:(d)CMP kinase [Oscillospiraceae bacterium]
MEQQSIAIDGPSGAGKSTLARLTARDFGIIHVDTGALYRAIGLFVRRRETGSRDGDAIARLLPEIKIALEFDGNGAQRVLLGGEDVSDAIRTPEASRYASDVSALKPVRAFLLGTQRDLAGASDVVMDGRDIGTVVLPSAGVKVFLTASPEVRAERRLLELREKGVETTYGEVLSDIITRDGNDSSRREAPLREADGAVRLDTSELTLPESFEVLRKIIAERLR